ncbi:hypothetical protein IWW34DRAFT_578180, partial [Fusarium oxysporum f. sp. albedinis]
MILYSLGLFIICRHQTRFTTERKFSRLANGFQLLALGNSSRPAEVNSFVRHDIGGMAIVWALMKGDEIPEFTCHGHLRTAIMLPASIANQFVRSVIMFEPSTFEQVSPRTM